MAPLPTIFESGLFKFEGLTFRPRNPRRRKRAGFVGESHGPRFVTALLTPLLT